MGVKRLYTISWIQKRAECGSMAKDGLKGLRTLAHAKTNSSTFDNEQSSKSQHRGPCLTWFGIYSGVPQGFRNWRTVQCASKIGFQIVAPWPMGLQNGSHRYGI